MDVMLQVNLKGPSLFRVGNPELQFAGDQIDHRHVVPR